MTHHHSSDDRETEKPRPVKLYAWGGQTRVNDYLMSDGTVKAMTLNEAKAAGYGIRPSSSAGSEPVTRYGEPAIPHAIKAIRAWQANKATSYTPTDILNDCGDAILAALTSAQPQPSADTSIAVESALSFLAGLPMLSEYSRTLRDKAVATLHSVPMPAQPQSSGVREAVIEECARACEARIRGKDGLEGGNDWGHNAPYNAEDKACAAAIRALALTRPQRVPQ
jgi:hypothetical protein